MSGAAEDFPTAPADAEQIGGLTVDLTGHAAGDALVLDPTNTKIISSASPPGGVDSVSFTLPLSNTGTARNPVGALTGTIDGARLPSGIDAAKIADGSVSNAEFQRLDGITGNIQTQLDGKQATLTLPLSVANGGTGGITGGISFGNGSDGPTTISSTVTLTRSMNYTTLIIASGGILNTQCFQVYAQQSVTVQSGGIIQCNGNDASGANRGLQLGGFFIGGSPGGQGATTAGNAGTNASASPGGSGGAGGAGTSGAGGSAGVASTGVDANYSVLCREFGFYTPNQAGFRSGAGGGGGGGNGTNSGGGGGGGSGVIMIKSPTITVAAGGTIQANGGAGANGTASNCGGGGGGGGGVISLLYFTYSNSGTVRALGGSKGLSGGGSGFDGSDGSVGSILTWQLP